ncbi:endonuclease/exonuclease/phosphatase family protein [Loktanella sp. Alg231-35]|uniref:endonuclease/exonuclease/phosphatase family protein n=1 Tax=Loktanella sp. Alg231-35 TaxID=1922220 RepID=UPI000D559647|nr:endonuclease/exonuclease/phosphatase family protein [Loktanella sp. Alg231-35]
MLAAGAASADTYRIATFAAPLSRDGPGLLLRDLIKGEDATVKATIDVIAHIAPDILVLTDFDYDLDGAALALFADRFGAQFPHQFALQPNSGMPTGRDIDANARLGDARDAQGFGRFAGDGGMAILSRFPILTEDVVDHSKLLWADLPGAILPQTAAGPFFDEGTLAILRLSSTGHWIVPVTLPDGLPVSLLAHAATPPVFDGPEDMNGLRNRDELRLWRAVLDGRFGTAPSSFVVAGNANLDPSGGQGFSEAMAGFLSDPRLQDPLPGQATADWPDDDAGNLRVSYVLPSRDWTVTDAGVFWPAPDDPQAALLGDDGLAAGVHHLVWVDISR